MIKIMMMIILKKIVIKEKVHKNFLKWNKS